MISSEILKKKVLRKTQNELPNLNMTLYRNSDKKPVSTELKWVLSMNNNLWVSMETIKGEGVVCFYHQLLSKEKKRKERVVS